MQNLLKVHSYIIVVLYFLSNAELRAHDFRSDSLFLTGWKKEVNVISFPSAVMCSHGKNLKSSRATTLISATNHRLSRSGELKSEC